MGAARMRSDKRAASSERGVARRRCCCSTQAVSAAVVIRKRAWLERESGLSENESDDSAAVRKGTMRRGGGEVLGRRVEAGATLVLLARLNLNARW